MTASDQFSAPIAARPSRRALLGSSVAAGLAAGGGALARPATAGDPAGTSPAGGHGGAAPEPACRLALDPETRHQRIEGFGASGAWWAQNLGTWSPPRRAQVARLLFSRGQGIGLSQYRYNIGGGDRKSVV